MPSRSRALLAAGLLAAAGQQRPASAQSSQCTPDYLSSMQNFCCLSEETGDDLCTDGTGVPPACSGNCATLFLDYFNNCDAVGGMQDQMAGFARKCQKAFHRCPNGNSDCASQASCIPDLTTHADACICSPQFMGDGSICALKPAFVTASQVPADIASGRCTPATVDGPAIDGTVTADPAVYCLD
eukprot:SAG22_NODE_6506_length_846_cov_0.795181_1_plen_184_part_10